MDSERAKLLLSGYRPGGPEAGDMEIAEALKLVARDPGLGRWFSEQCALDDRMRGALQSLHPPPELKDAILLSGGMIRLPIHRPSWARPAVRLAIAASLVLALGIAALLRAGMPRPIPLATLTGEIAHMQAEGRISMGAMGSDFEDFRRWLAEHHAPHDFRIPPALAAQHGLGCQVYSIKRNKVSLICFQLDDMRMVHYFVIDRGRLVDPPGSGQSVILEEHGLSFVAWSDQRRTYVLAGTGGIEQLKRLL